MNLRAGTAGAIGFRRDFCYTHVPVEEDGRFAHFLFVALICNGFTSITGNHVGWTGL